MSHYTTVLEKSDKKNAMVVKTHHESESLGIHIRGSCDTWRHPDHVRFEAERLVIDTLEDMLRTAHRKSSELDLPKKWRPRLEITWHPNRRTSYHKRGTITLALCHYVPRNGVGEASFTYTEYKRLQKEPAIGGFTTNDWRNCVRALVAHELAHAIQRSGVPHHKGRHRKIDYKKPHGHGFQQLYALLRRKHVRPFLDAEKMDECISI